MGGFICNCNNIIKTNEIPNPSEWLLISDVTYDNYFGQIDAEELYKEMKSMYLCSHCKRIWIFWEGHQNVPLSYILEE